MKSQRQLTSHHSSRHSPHVLERTNSRATAAALPATSRQRAESVLQIRIILDSICTRIKKRATIGPMSGPPVGTATHTRTHTMVRIASVRMILVLAAALGTAATGAAADLGGKQSQK